MSANITSSVTNILGLDNIAYQANVTNGSSPVGTLTAQVSLDYAADSQGNVTNAGNWTNIQTAPGTDLSLSVTTNGTYTLNLAAIAAPWIRLVYTKTSGSGTMNAFIAGKHV